ncbi:HXXEE domain-containing protein [Cytobacillus massiliigabonensis]|uniref:HXXEE domain-containing protein n=1 Tax=Cytobacillus massiliigabonensis TaxID=1871011 RepID=UPI000C85190B|nr:HXXEE domain-containing protein [Cytobacillus massiliigabonensis]
MKIYYAIFFCLAITLHNLEEAIWLPQWSQLGLFIQKPVTPNEFHFAVIIITSLAYLLSFLYISFPHSNLLKWAFIGFLGSMIFNAIFPHLLAAIFTKTYAPGLVTALLLNIPINTVILYRLHMSNHIKIKEILISAIVVGFLLIAMIPFLFTLGNNIIIF